MIAKTEKNDTFLNRIKGIEQTPSGKAPHWFMELKRQGVSRVTELGFPTVKDEEWKYTNVKPVIERSYHFAKNDHLKELPQLQRYYNPNEINVVFVNGFFSQQLSNMKKIPDGIKILTFQEAAQEKEINLESIIKKFDTKQESTFIALTKALTNNGIYVEVAEKVICEELIHIIHITSPDAADIICTPYTLVKAGKSAQAAILESYLSFNNETVYFTNSVTDIVIEENAVLTYCKAQSEGLKSYHIGSTRVWQERNSSLLGFSLMVGAQLTRNNLDVLLNGEGANATLNGLYCVNGTQHVDNHTLVDHREPNCTSNQLYKGILNGASRAVFNGKIWVKPIAQKTNSYQLNKNLILGEDCQIDTKPQLEIGADDVKCTHGATIGQLNEDEIFYLQSRAISKKNAIGMLSKGFVDDILNTIHNESINQKLHQLLEPTFAALSK